MTLEIWNTITDFLKSEDYKKFSVQKELKRVFRLNWLKNGRLKKLLRSESQLRICQLSKWNCSYPFFSRKSAYFSFWFIQHSGITVSHYKLHDNLNLILENSLLPIILLTLKMMAVDRILDISVNILYSTVWNIVVCYVQIINWT